MHPARVVNVKSPNGNGDVKAVCGGVFGKEASIWIPCIGASSVGSDKEERGHTGLWNPAQPGQEGYIVFPAGHLNKPTFIAAGPWMKAKGKAEA